MNRRLKVGIIGAGRIGRLHAEHLAFRIPDAEVVAIADPFVENARRCAGRCGIPKVFEDYHDILNDPKIDAVVVCSPTDTHAKITIESAERGKHVFCEKPISHDLKEIDDVLNAVEKSGIKFQVGFNRRFDSNFRRIKKAVESGEIGDPYIIHVISRDPEPPSIDYVKSSGGIFLDMTIHDFDMVRYIIGDEVEEVYVVAGVMVDERIGEVGDLDTAIITLRFRNGVMGTIDNCRKAVYGYDQRVEVFGSKGVISAQNNYPNNTVRGDETGFHRDPPLRFFMERYIESYVEEMKEFVNAVLNDGQVPVGGIDGKIPVVMGMAARKSYDENRPVKLSEICSI